MREAFQVSGRLSVYALFDDIVSSSIERQASLKDGTCRLVHTQRNLVVNNGLSAFSRLLGGGVGTPLIGGLGFSTWSEVAVTTMELGAAAVPPPPQATDTNGVGALVYTPRLVVEYPDPYTVSFSGVIPILELIGTTITEECLRLGNGLVFAKVKLATPTLKTGATALQFVHDISLVRA